MPHNTPATPPYYRAGSGDLYDVCLAQVGTAAMHTHLRLSALEYLYRCEEKGSYRRDLEKAQVILARLLAWEADPPTAEAQEVPASARDPEASTAVPPPGWPVVADATLAGAYRRVALAPQDPAAVFAAEVRALLRQYTPPCCTLAPLDDAALAAQCQARGWGVIRPTEGPEAPVAARVEWTPRFQTLETAAPGAAPVLVADEEDAPALTVFAHCLACELAQPPERAWSAAEVHTRLGRLGIPAEARYADHAAELARRETRWHVTEAGRHGC